MIDRLSLGWAFLGAPVTFAVFVFVSYRYSLARGGLPISEMPDWTWFVAFAVSGVSGVAAMSVFLTRTKAFHLAWLAFYTIGIVIINSVLHVLIACGFGDCF